MVRKLWRWLRGGGRKELGGELFPTLLMNGDTIVEVGFTRWHEATDGLSWSMDQQESRTFTLPGDIDRVVIETALGCYQFRQVLHGGDTLTFRSDDGPSTPMERCHPLTREQQDALVQLVGH